MSDTTILQKNKQENKFFVSQDTVFDLHERSEDWSDQQLQTAQTLSQSFKNDSVLSMVHTETMTPEEMESAYNNKYVEKLNVKKANEGSREMKRVRKSAAAKAKNAMELQKKLMELADDGTDYQRKVDNNATLKRIALSTDIEIGPLKVHAPTIYLRGQKLTHAVEVLEFHKEEMPELYEYAKTELAQAQSEWRRIKELMCKPTVNEVRAKKERNTRGLNEYNGKIDVPLTDIYKAELRKNQKKRVIYGKNKTDIEIPAEMKQELDHQMDIIKRAFPGVTEEEVENTVNEYLERMLDKAEYRMRANPNAVIGILNERAHCKSNEVSYNNLVKKMFCNRTDNPDASQIINFGYLGGKKASDFVGYKSKSGTESDPLGLYGKVAIKLDKKRFIKKGGHVSFQVGNSLGNLNTKHSRSAIVDKEKGWAPDITCCGRNLYSVYKRAAELKKDGWKKMTSPEQEAKYVAVNEGSYMYFEADYQGQISSGEIEELTYIADTGIISLKAQKKNLRDNKEFKNLYEMVNIINNKPSEYGREGMPPLKLTVWDKNGHGFSFEEVISIMEADEKVFETEKKE